MFIAHLPAGYLLTKYLLPKLTMPARPALLAGLFFSIAPDLDLLWFYAFSSRTVPHRYFISHWPVLWFSIAAAIFLCGILIKKTAWKKLAFIALANALLHLGLDSITAEVFWLAPFSGWALNLVTVPAVHSWWVWNFILHWIFAVELLICACAAIFFIKGGTFKYSKTA